MAILGRFRHYHPKHRNLTHFKKNGIFSVLDVENILQKPIFLSFIISRIKVVKILLILAF